MGSYRAMDTARAVQTNKRGFGSLIIWAAVIAILHPVSLGLVHYAHARGWMGPARFPEPWGWLKGDPYSFCAIFYYPEEKMLELIRPLSPGLEEWYRSYLDACARAGAGKSP
jgi:hypothetical protein